MVNRRQLLKLLALGVAGLELDLDRLLWVPGKKTIFLPSPEKELFTYKEIIDIELNQIASKIPSLFEEEITFYRIIAHYPNKSFVIKNIEVPLILGKKDDV